MGGNSLSALQEPIRNGDGAALKQVLAKYGRTVPLLLRKQFIANDDECLMVEPIFTTPLQYCISCNEPECLKVLLEAGGDPNEGGKGGATLIHKACKKVSIECVKVLLQHGARVYDCDEWGVYPIHTCVAAYGDFDDSRAILDILLEAGKPTDIHLKDGEYEKLPLHYAAFYGNQKMCQHLLDLGVDINAKDKHGRTAYQSCVRQKKIQEFLKSKGCDVPEPTKAAPLPPIFPLFANKTAVDQSESENILTDANTSVGSSAADQTPVSASNIQPACDESATSITSVQSVANEA
ncbi:ankyrin repeat and SOCS box protein 16-like [Watersipora subatra]|uniref:ankyrin repeat and SOCS box protein 16-like n=1 Tax=Watersipora subatra TaxID=2589382 RepID=UPI00355B0335